MVGGSNPAAPEYKRRLTRPARRPAPKHQCNQSWSACVIFVAVDIGGTFTDLIGFDDEAQTLRPGQEPDHAGANSTQGIIDCLRKSGIDAGRDRRADPRLDHRDQHADRAQGRQDRPRRDARHPRRLHHRPRQPAGGLQPVLPPPPAAGAAPAHPRGGRAAARLRRGARAAEEVRASPRPARRSKAEGVEAVAVCFLHAYANPEHERVAGEMIRKALPDAYLSLSHEILREYREFERMSTTVVNAYIGPKVGGYVKSLKSSLGGIGFKRRSVDHALERRRDDAGGRDRAAGGDDGVRAGRRHHRLGAGRPGARASQRHLVRHGRHHRQGEPDPRRRADAGARLLRRRLCQRPSGDAADDRRGRGRRRRRLHRLARRHRRAEGRPAERGRRSRPDLLSRRRHRADHHRRQRGARPARPGQFPRRHDEARRRRRARAASRRRSPSRSSSTWSRRRRRSSRSRSTRCRSRCARCRSPRATIRATSRWWPPAARARCTSARSPASCTSRP